ncbi:hypothetical protein HPB50_018425 [Hyalomma asiaticum]|uniref:Uncharacterized protein n=1 Tax=Hyalomma asiaticum TaxID=266040 RepID=A0ACB7TMJ8_HYAAI|nr:hypothetical protein HPB50_018425 [Hyalomma asiaticum]
MSTEVSNLARVLRKEIRELKRSLEFMNKQYETLNQDCADVKTKNKAPQQMLTEEVETLKKQLQEASLKVTSHDKYSRNRNIEIEGIPHEKTEKLVDVLGKVGDALGEPIKEQVIEVCHRVASLKAATEQSIVVVFNHRAKREQVSQESKSSQKKDKRYVTTTQVGVATPFGHQLFLLDLAGSRGLSVHRRAWDKSGWHRKHTPLAQRQRTEQTSDISCLISQAGDFT